jgi:flavin reductase (DIM6/NTAB) family NADH-FMN oxidoreductase RutF
MTASAFTSVSLSPPMVLIVVDRRWRSHDLIESGGVFCVNILAEDQVRWSDRFAGRHGEMPDRFVDVATTRAATGCACLAQATAWLDCRIAQMHRAGDHTVFIGHVLAASVMRPDASPLLYHDGRYRQLSNEAAQE